MKRSCLLIILLLLITTITVNAKPGCCSGKYHGVAYCGDSGHYVCNNGEVSPSCTCDEPDYTTYEEDEANGDLYYGEDEDFINDDEGESLGIVDQNGNVSHLSDEDSEEEEPAEKEASDYIGIIALLATVAGGSYAAGNVLGKRK